MRATLEPQAEDGDAAFPRRTAGRQRGWQAAVLLCQAKLTNAAHLELPPYRFRAYLLLVPISAL